MTHETDDAFERWLESAIETAPQAPAGFTDAVMDRLEREPAPPRVAAWAAAPRAELPWWLEVMRQPAVVLAAAVAALLAWRGNALLATGSAAATWLANTAPSVASAASHSIVLWTGLDSLIQPAAPGGTWVVLGLLLGFAPLIAYASLGLGNWMARFVARRVLSAS